MNPASRGLSGVAPLRWAVAGLYLGAVALASWAGCRMTVWLHWHLLDPAVLREHPFAALLYLHAQPPALNSLFSLLLAAERVVGEPFEALAAGVFDAVGLGIALLLGELVRRAAGTAMALAAVAVLLVDPGFHFYRVNFFYPLLLAGEVLGCVYFGWRFVEAGREVDFAVTGLAAVGLTATSTLFHPLASALFLGLVVGWRWRLANGRFSRRERWAAARWLALCCLLLVAWPLKNALVFGEFVTTSWAGFNLSRFLPVEARENGDLMTYIRSGEVAPWAQDAWRSRRRPAGWAGEMLAAPIKSDGKSRNWHHYLFLLTNEPLSRAGWGWRFSHPGAWMGRALAYYRQWSLPTHLNSYTLRPFIEARGGSMRFWRWAARHQAVVFPGLRPRVALTDPAPWTAPAVVGFPALLAFGGATLWRRRRAPTAAAAAFSLALFWFAWTLVVPCLTDGVEGNRMRFATAPLIPFLCAFILVEARREWRRPRRGAPQPASP